MKGCLRVILAVFTLGFVAAILLPRHARATTQAHYRHVDRGNLTAIAARISFARDAPQLVPTGLDPTAVFAVSTAFLT